MATFTTFDGISLTYVIEGEGLPGEPPVVLLHGFTSSIEGNWKRPGIWQSLLDAGRVVIGMDARGHGQSDKPHEPAAYENSAMVRDVGALFDHLRLTSADLVGYSMGAATAIRFAAADRRVRRLVLGGIGGDPGEWRAPEVLAERAERAKRIVAGLEADDPATISDPLAARVRKLMEARDNDLAAMAAIQRAHRPMGGDVDIASVLAPTLVVCGEDDVAPQPLADALPHGQAHLLAGDHEGVVTNPELAKVITAFVCDDSGIDSRAAD